MKHALRVTAGAVLLAAAGWSIASADTPSVEGPAPTPPAAEPLATPSVAIVATELGTGVSELYRVGPVAPHGSSGEGLQPLASFSHLPEGNVRAEVVAGTPVVVVNAPVRPGRDISFNGALLALRPGGPAAELCRDVVHASRPLVTDSGRVYVSRGKAGPRPDHPHPGTYRIDWLTIDEVDVATGQVRPVHAYAGYLAHLAGWYGPELLLYRAGPEGADIVAVHAETGTVREVLDELPPFARDFSVDRARGVLVYRGRHETHTRRWTIEELELASGDSRRLHEGASFALSPHVWPGGGVVFSPGRRGWALIGSADPVTSPMDAGVDLLRDVSPDQRYVAALHTVAGQLGVPFVVDRRTGAVSRLAAPTGRLIAVAGFLGEEGSP